ncbi:ABC transporter ATP-binding protein [Compostimonas suwonensis]|uniref:Branched-chain amino acid transport system ATP-binding protein n=1 Tax=Compostimonas suwonensis TaxID=1048394 RepID=A0A2M9BCE8_9MICO|nr:ABC transporter ATP-binding protein [Compostimonas suwonensis]PJJ55611.1 branched-chain amino acid transport system ATP-binding protein [Compostimonas suwonensis]
MLEVTDVRCGYPGGPDVLDDISITVAAGEIVSLVGLNGAGKSTLVKAISGMLPLRGGSVVFRDDDVSQLSCDARVRRGLMLVPEGRELFPSMSVAETLRLGTYPIPRPKRSALAGPALERVFDLFPVLAERRKQAAGTLSGGEQQMLAIARALMSSPAMLVLDEPSLGLAPRLIETIFLVLQELNREGLTILLVEQNATIALDVSDRAYMLELGRVIRHGPSAELRDTVDLMDLVAGTTSEEDSPVAASGREMVELPHYSRAGGSNESRKQHDNGGGRA